MEKTNRRAGELVIQAIKKQIRLKDPPETKETFDRLRHAGYAKEEIYRMLGCVLTSETCEVLKEEREFNRDLYVQHLHALPSRHEPLGVNQSKSNSRCPPSNRLVNQT